MDYINNDLFWEVVNTLNNTSLFLGIGLGLVWECVS